jgi:thymidylate synthase (FAD)
MIDIIQAVHGTTTPEIKVLDQGHVALWDCMPRLIPEGTTGDFAVTQAARVSYQKGTKSISEDKGLIRFLYRHLHTTPFEMVEFKFACKMPVFVARQWIRHRTASVNEMSGRYSVLPDEFYIPTPDNVRAQSTVNKQMTEGQVEDLSAEQFLATLNETSETCYAKYEKALADGVGREQARMLLPVNLYTAWIWKIDLHNLLHFLKLRCDSHAQYEIRVFADAILELIKPIVPWSVEAWDDYSPYRGATTLSRLEKERLVQTNQWQARQRTHVAERLNRVVSDLAGEPNNPFIVQIRSDVAHALAELVQKPDLDLKSGNKREDAEWTDKIAKLGLSQTPPG